MLVNHIVSMDSNKLLLCGNHFGTCKLVDLKTLDNGNNTSLFKLFENLTIIQQNIDLDGHGEGIDESLGNVV